MAASATKIGVTQFWQRASCGEALLLPADDQAGYEAHAAERYRLEPYILPFIEPSRWRGKKVLEVGVGLGADHQQLATAGAILSGIDITERAIRHCERRLSQSGLTSDLRVGDAENLPFEDCSFDCVISYGVIHHTPDTARAAREILRVLKPGGDFRVMVYHRRSIVGFMLWLRYGWWRGRGLAAVFAAHNESPGTKAYLPDEAKTLFPGCAPEISVTLSHADLLSSGAGQRHRGIGLTIARAIWPRWLIRRLFSRYGAHLLISGTKPYSSPTG